MKIFNACQRRISKFSISAQRFLVVRWRQQLLWGDWNSRPSGPALCSTSFYGTQVALEEVHYLTRTDKYTLR